MHPMRVVGVRVELPANQPVLLLREEDGVRYLPIWIGAVEASAIAFQQQGVKTARPLTHDLLRDVVQARGLAPGSRAHHRGTRGHSSTPSCASPGASASSAPHLMPSHWPCAAMSRSWAATLVLDSRRDRDPRRAGGRGREVPRVPRQRLAGGLREGEALTPVEPRRTINLYGRGLDFAARRVDRHRATRL